MDLFPTNNYVSPCFLYCYSFTERFLVTCSRTMAMLLLLLLTVLLPLGRF